MNGWGFGHCSFQLIWLGAGSILSTLDECEPLITGYKSCVYIYIHIHIVEYNDGIYIHYITSHYSTLHYITSLYITLHYIHYILYIHLGKIMNIQIRGHTKF